MKKYLVVFTSDREEDLNVNLDEQFWTVRLRAKNSKDARRKAWKIVHGRKGCKWLVRGGWYIWNTGLGSEDWPAGIRRAYGTIEHGSR